MNMGYRGEDASRTRADSRRQSPWQSSARPGAAEAWDEGSRGYAQDDEYARADGYGGYQPDDSYAGYDDYGQAAQYGAAGGGHATGGYDAAGGYGAAGYGASGGYSAMGGRADGQDGYGARHSSQRNTDEYAASNGYARDEYPADGYGSRYDQGGEYGQDAGYGQSGPYRQQGGGYGDNGYAGDGYADGGYTEQNQGRGFGSGPYQQQQPDALRTTGGQRIGGRRRPGGYPAIGAGSGGEGTMGAPDAPVRRGDARNDWYNGQPAAASGSGFADTGVHNFGSSVDRDPVRGYPPAPGRPAQLEAPASSGMVHTGQQERYDDTQYDAYPVYTDQQDYRDARDYGGPNGYQQSGGYNGYDEPREFGQRGRGTQQGYDYDEDPYQERYGDDGKPPPGGEGGRRNKTGRRPGRRKRPLLISALAVVVVAAAAGGGYVYLHRHKPAGNTAVDGPLPTSSASVSAATAACVKELGEYCHIELRADDPVPLTLAELFPPAFTNETDHMSFTRIGTRLDKTCSTAVIGQNLISALKSDACTQVLRASYLSGDGKIMGTIGVINLATTNEAHHAGKVVGANDFIMPLSTSKGIGSKLGSGTGVVEAEFKGHYLILTWAEFTSGKAPSTKAQDAQLEAFNSGLVAGSANIPLSERMVNGVAPTAAAAVTPTTRAS